MRIADGEFNHRVYLSTDGSPPHLLAESQVLSHHCELRAIFRDVCRNSNDKLPNYRKVTVHRQDLLTLVTPPFCCNLLTE